MEGFWRYDFGSLYLEGLIFRILRYVAKNWALAMMLKALPLVHFWSILLLKEQMMTSVRKTLKLLV